FGELALRNGAPRTASVMALEQTAVLELSREGLDKSGARHGLGDTLVRMVCQERLLADALRSSTLLATLPPELGVQLGSALVPHVARQGEVLLTHGQQGDALYVLLRGRCAVFHPHGDGDTTRFPDLEEGAVFGEVSLLRSRLATATVRAETPCTLLRLERDVFVKYFRSQPALRRALVKLGLERLRRTSRLVEDARSEVWSY
ncbi:cyclic nucleotide-binding domain-containing protein, partial [Pyxidicoccus fallax]